MGAPDLIEGDKVEVLVSVPYDTDNVMHTKSPQFRNGSRS